MKHFAHYDLESGEVFSFNMSLSAESFSGGQGSLELTTETYGEIRKSKTGAYVRNGSLILKPSMPSGYHFWDKTNKAWVLDEAKQAAGESERIRSLRDQLLADSDWTDTLSFRTRKGDAVADAWASYRQALRDVTGQPGFPLNVEIPTEPQFSNSGDV